jgi:hypothetical protein
MQKAYKNLNIRFLPDRINEVLPDEVYEISPGEMNEALPDEVYEISPGEMNEALPDEVYEISPPEMNEALPDEVYEISPPEMHEETIFIPESGVNLKEVIHMDHSDIIVNPIKIALNTHINSTIENGVFNDKEEFINTIVQLNSNISNQDIFINHESIFESNANYFSYFVNDFIHFSDSFSDFLSNIYC